MLEKQLSFSFFVKGRIVHFKSLQLCVCVCVNPEDNLRLVFSFPHVGSGIELRSLRLGLKCLYLLSHNTCSISLF